MVAPTVQSTITQTLQAGSPFAAGAPAVVPNPASFSAILSGQVSADASDPHSPQAIRKVAGDLVSQALIQPILKQIRRGTFAKNTPFSPGIGEKTFGPQFDVQIADRIAHSPRMAPTDAIAAHLMRRVSPPAAAPVAAAPGVDVHG